jgi:hypothetical protein
MRRKSGSAKSEKLTLRFTEYQFELIETAAKQANVSPTAYLEAIIADVHPRKQASLELEAYQLWFSISRRVNKTRSLLSGIGGRMLQGKVGEEISMILIRMDNLAQESVKLVDELADVTVRRK